ncbi:MAG: hypothetical protein ACYC0L_07080 [Thermoleophilia bacterium]
MANVEVAPVAAKIFPEAFSFIIMTPRKYVKRPICVPNPNAGPIMKYQKEKN